MKLTKSQQAMIDDLYKRSKGWPVGLWCEEKVARQLVEADLAEWAVPNYPSHYNKRDDLLSIRLTTKGQAHSTFYKS